MRRYACEPVSLSFVEDAPVRFVNSVVIDASPSAIWAALEDAAAWPRWADPILHVEWTSPRPFGLGTTRTVSMAGKMVGWEEFIAWDVNRCMAFRFNEASMNNITAFAESYTLEAVSGTRTRITWVMAMAPKGISKVFLPLVHWPMEKYFGKLLGQFKTLVEGQYRNR